MKNEYEIERGNIRLDGNFDLVFQPSSLMAYSGSFQAGIPPVRSGSCWTWPRRFFEADRFSLRHGILKGSLWLGLQHLPYTTALPTTGETLFVVSQKLLFAENSQRQPGDRLSLIPGSVKKSLILSVFVPVFGEMPPVACTESPVTQAFLDADETLHVTPSSLVAWSGCEKPSAFCARLSLKDLILPRLPETLTLNFKGPGRVFFQGAAIPGKQKCHRHK